MYTMVYGADSETCHGKPNTLQFYSEDGNGENQIIFVDEHNAMDEFMWWCGTLPRHMTHVIYCHHLPFDIVSFFYKAHRRLDSEFEFTYGNWKIKGCFGKPTFVRINSSDRDRRTIYIVDSLLWYQGSLSKAAELFCPGLPKLKRPRGLGDKIYTAKDDSFCEYAMRDAEVAYHIGKAVQAMHEQYDIPQAVSLASMSASIFKKHFLKYTIDHPRDQVQEAAKLSYHGGKNNLMTGVAPAWHEGIWGLDISSAYPFAMFELPAFAHKKLYRTYRLHKGHVREVPPFGVYKISGNVAECEWPCIFDHSFKPQHGRVRDLWVQGLELNEALASGELKLSNIRGYYYEHEKDNEPPAFKNFVSEFYGKKQSEKEPVWRHMYKTTLNSNYGKWIQTRKKKAGYWIEIDPETDEPYTFEVKTHATAGGMYHPFIASAITAHTRAYIHQIEHKYEAIHTATDGIFTHQKNPSTIMRGRPRKGLGSLETEIQNATLLLIRNKCYIVYGRKSKKTFPSKAFKGKHIVKFAKHGFMGSVYELERLIAKNRRKYSTKRANTLKASLKAGKQVNDFEKKDYTLKIGPIKLASDR